MAQNKTTHKVKSGETLFSIAQNNNVTVQQLKKWNHLSSNNIHVGQKLIIKKPAQGASKSGSTFHTVKSGETLFSIAQQYGISVASLKKWNSLKDATIHVGTKLRVKPPKNNSSQVTASTPSPKTKNNSHNSNSTTYRVKPGDSLYRIAHMHNMTVERLKQLNHLSSNNIRVGQKLLVKSIHNTPSVASSEVNSSAQGKFVRYTVKKARSRSSLLKKFRMDEAEFKALNPDLHTTYFHRGDKVDILAPANKSYKNPYLVHSSMKNLGTMPATKYKANTIGPTTNGELYNPQALTAGSSNLAMGSVIFIRNNRTNRGVYVRINDRTTGKGLKLSKAAWNTLGLKGNRAHVTIYRTKTNE